MPRLVEAMPRLVEAILAVCHVDSRIFSNALMERGKALSAERQEQRNCEKIFKNVQQQSTTICYLNNVRMDSGSGWISFSWFILRIANFATTTWKPSALSLHTKKKCLASMKICEALRKWWWKGVLYVLCNSSYTQVVSSIFAVNIPIVYYCISYLITQTVLNAKILISTSHWNAWKKYFKLHAHYIILSFNFTH